MSSLTPARRASLRLPFVLVLMVGALLACAGMGEGQGEDGSEPPPPPPPATDEPPPPPPETPPPPPKEEWESIRVTLTVSVPIKHRSDLRQTVNETIDAELKKRGYAKAEDVDVGKMACAREQCTSEVKARFVRKKKVTTP